MYSKFAKKGRERTCVVSHAKTPRGREVWHIVSDGQIHTSVTSATSAKVMDDAVRVYGGALERLAKR